MLIVKSEIPLDASCPFRIEQQILKQTANRPDLYHWHTCFEITFIRRGKGLYFVNQTTYEVSEGDIIIFNNIEPHAWECLSEEMDLLVMVFMPEYIESTSTLLGQEYLRPFIERGSNFKNKLDHEDPMTIQICGLMEEIEREQAEQPEAYLLMIRADVLKLLTLLIRYSQDRSKSGALLKDKQEKIQRLTAVFEHLHTHYQERISLQEAAAIAYMSPNYFSVYFKKVTGQNYSDYLNHLRVRRAEHLLASTDLNILDIATRCGFSNMSNFYRIFRRITGTSPTIHRKKETE